VKRINSAGSPPLTGQEVNSGQPRLASSGGTALHGKPGCLLRQWRQPHANGADDNFHYRRSHPEKRRNSVKEVLPANWSGWCFTGQLADVSEMSWHRPWINGQIKTFVGKKGLFA